LGNTPGSRRILPAPKMAPSAVGGYQGMKRPQLDETNRPLVKQERSSAVEQKGDCHGEVED
jgi:hypothetical protein